VQTIFIDNPAIRFYGNEWNYRPT